MRHPLVGMSHRLPANAVLGFLPPETSLYFVREPENQYDPNAIQVWLKNPREAIADEEALESLNVILREAGKDILNWDEPFMLGYMKAQSIDDEHPGADIMAPRIDKMVEDGTIGSAAEIPVILVYGTTGRPSVQIVDPNSDSEEVGDMDSSDAEAMSGASALEDADAEAAEAVEGADGEDFTQADHD